MELVGDFSENDLCVYLEDLFDVISTCYHSVFMGELLLDSFFNFGSDGDSGLSSKIRKLAETHVDRQAF